MTKTKAKTAKQPKTANQQKYDYVKCIACPRLTPVEKGSLAGQHVVGNFCTRCTTSNDFREKHSWLRRRWWEFTGRFEQRYIEEVLDLCQQCLRQRPLHCFRGDQSGPATEVPVCLECELKLGSANPNQAPKGKRDG